MSYVFQERRRSLRNPKTGELLKEYPWRYVCEYQTQEEAEQAVKRMNNPLSSKQLKPRFEGRYVERVGR